MGIFPETLIDLQQNTVVPLLRKKEMITQSFAPGIA